MHIFASELSRKFILNDIDKLLKRIFSGYLLCPDVYEKKFALTGCENVFQFLLIVKTFDLTFLPWILDVSASFFYQCGEFFLPIYKNNNDIIVFINYLAIAECHNIFYFFYLDSLSFVTRFPFK